jgi:hypothetical protein
LKHQVWITKYTTSESVLSVGVPKLTDSIASLGTSRKLDERIDALAGEIENIRVSNLELVRSRCLIVPKKLIAFPGID